MGAQDERLGVAPLPHGIVTDHWPTFNVADVAICVGVALMAIDMFSAKRSKTGTRCRRRRTPPIDQPAPTDPNKS